MLIWKRITAAVCAAIMMMPVCLPAAADEKTAPILYFGDVDQNGEVDVADVVALQKYILGLTHLKDENAVLCADMNSDKAVDIFDLGLLKSSILSTMKAREDGSFIYAPLTKFYGSMPSQGSGQMMVFYVDFPDCKYEYEPSVEELTQICFGNDSDPDDPNYPFCSMRSFLRRSSKGVFDLNGKVFRYTAKNPISYYEGDGDKPKLMEELFQYYNRFVDFSAYDGNQDGLIDNILVNVPNSAAKSEWWPLAGQNYSNLEADGVKLGHTIIGYDAVKSADDHKGFVSSYLHETGHTMGLPDYYLYFSKDIEGFHGESGNAMMDSDRYSDYCCFSKLMLGWYREKQVQVYDQSKGGEQTFVLKNAQSLTGNCLLLPCGALDGNYNSEYMILEYNTDSGNNIGINRDMKQIYGFEVVSGIRAFHVNAKAEDRTSYSWLTYRKNTGDKVRSDDGIRILRLVNDAEGGKVFHSGDVLDGSLSGFHWYASDGTESVETGYTVKIGAFENDGYTVSVSKTS